MKNVLPERMYTLRQRQPPFKCHQTFLVTEISVQEILDRSIKMREVTLKMALVTRTLYGIKLVYA